MEMFVILAFAVGMFLLYQRGPSLFEQHVFKRGRHAKDHQRMSQRPDFTTKASKRNVSQLKISPLLLVGMLLMVALAGCGNSTERSVEAYCNTMVKHRDRYLTAMDNTGDLSGLIGAAGAIGDLKTMWDEMAAVAPSEIRADTEAVRDSWKKAEEAAISGDFMGLFGNAMFNSAPIERVDAYIIDNCDPYLSTAPGNHVLKSHKATVS